MNSRITLAAASSPQALGVFTPGTKVVLTALVNRHRYYTAETEVLLRTVLDDVRYRAVFLPAALELAEAAVELSAVVDCRDLHGVQVTLLTPGAAGWPIRLRWYIEAVAA